jgi:Thiamine pyrophosphate enzyme, C-terminal TPP binding domain
VLVPSIILAEFQAPQKCRIPLQSPALSGFQPLKSPTRSREDPEFPNPDFTALARACGGHGFRASRPGELHAEINEAFKVDGPAIVDCVVAADEMPNFPHLELDQVGNYAAAKIKEAVLAVTGP